MEMKMCNDTLTGLDCVPGVPGTHGLEQLRASVESPGQSWTLIDPGGFTGDLKRDNLTEETCEVFFFLLYIHLKHYLGFIVYTHKHVGLPDFFVAATRGHYRTSPCGVASVLRQMPLLNSNLLYLPVLKSPGNRKVPP